MAWTGVWYLDVDGTSLNDSSDYICFIPELDNLPPQQIVLTERDGDYPVFIRSQPQPGSFTFLIAMKSGVESAAAWQTSMQALRALFDPSVYHTLTAQVRGMESKKAVRFLTEGIQFDFKTKTAVVNAVAPKPTLNGYGF